MHGHIYIHTHLFSHYLVSSCTSLCVYGMCTCIYEHVHVCIWMCIHTVYVCVCTYLFVHMYIYTCTYVQLRVCVHAYADDAFACVYVTVHADEYALCIMYYTFVLCTMQHTYTYLSMHVFCVLHYVCSVYMVNAHVHLCE